MVTKLTLKINPSVIDRAESYARQRNKTVSKLVEKYLQRITEPDIPIQADPFSSPLIDSLVGVIPDDGKDYKTMIVEARDERFKEYL